MGKVDEVVLNYFMFRDMGIQPNRAWVMAMQLVRFMNAAAARELGRFMDVAAAARERV